LNGQGVEKSAFSNGYIWETVRDTA